MNLKAKISSGQFFSLLLLSRFISVLTYSPIYNAGLNSSDYLIAGVIGMIMVLFHACRWRCYIRATIIAVCLIWRMRFHRFIQR